MIETLYQLAWLHIIAIIAISALGIGLWLHSAYKEWRWRRRQTAFTMPPLCDSFEPMLKEVYNERACRDTLGQESPFKQLASEHAKGKITGFGHKIYHDKNGEPFIAVRITDD